MGADLKFTSVREYVNEIRPLLSEDDFEKLRILTVCNVANAVQCDSVKGSRWSFSEILNANNSEEYWTEAFFLIQRYDLLKRAGVCECDVYQRINVKTCFTPERRFLVKIYDEIPASMELEFCTYSLEILRKRGCSPLSSDCRSLSTILLEFYKILGIAEFRDVFVKLNLPDAVKECDSYLQEHRKKDLTGAYPMNTVPCGMCIIINNRYVRDEEPRYGSEIDKKCLEETFKQFNFEVRSYSDLNKTETLSHLNWASHHDHSMYSAFVCCIMSHGEIGSFYSADQEILSIEDDVILKFCGDNCKTLIGKPKVFLFQVCQGTNLQKARVFYRDLRTDGPKLVPNQADCLIGLASVKGCSSIRDVKRGSWFIQDVVKALGETSDFSDIIVKTNNYVVQRGCLYNSETFSQTPIWKTTLTRNLVLKRKS